MKRREIPSPYRAGHFVLPVTLVGTLEPSRRSQDSSEVAGIVESLEVEAEHLV